MASVPFWKDRLAKHGGNLVLTNRRVLFEPLNLNTVKRAGRLVRDIAAFGEERSQLSLDEIADVEPVDGWMPRLRLTTHNGRRSVFLIAGGRFSPPWSSRNREARDDAVEKISAAVSAR